MLSPKRNHDRIVGRCGLELEIERSTKTFSERETPSTIDSISERRMQNELHPARFIEETFHYEGLLRRNRAERAVRIREVIADLLSSASWQVQFISEPFMNVVVDAFSSP